MKTLGQYIRERREAQDISLREFAKKLGDLSAAFVSDVELGRRFPSEEVLAKMGRILGEKVEDLKKYDSRPPVEDLKRLSASDPSFGFALRKVVEKQLTAKDLLELIDKSEQRKKR